LDPQKAADAKMNLNFDVGGDDGKIAVELENGVLNHTLGKQLDSADATIKLSRDTLNDIMLGQTKLADAISAGDVKIDGDQKKLNELVSYLDTFKFWFNIVTPRDNAASVSQPASGEGSSSGTAGTDQ